MTRRHQEAEGQESMFGDAYAPSRPRRRRTMSMAGSLTEEEAKTRQRTRAAAAEGRKQVRRRVPYDDRPGTKLPKTSRSNVWFALNGENRPRASFDSKSRVYQRSASSSYQAMEHLTFVPEEIAKIKSLIPKWVEHIDLDHFDSDGNPLLDEMKCFRISYADMRAKGHWGETWRGYRWMVPLSAWEIHDRHGNPIGGTDAPTPPS